MPKTPVLFIHAFPFDARMWRPQRDHFATDRLVLAPDLQGFGSNTDGPGSLSVEQHADQVFALLDRSGISSAAVVGLSMGGYVALAMLRRAPERLRGLMLCDTKAQDDPPEVKHGRDLRIARIAREGVGFIADEMLPSLLADSASDDIKREALSIMRAQSAQGVVNALVALRDRPDVSAHLAAIRCPSCVVCGEHDRLTTPRSMREMASCIAGACFDEIPSAGHLSNLENPPAFNRHLDALLARVDAE